ncbi:chorismate-binding protein [Riemerella columbipharyngis]|uniref:Isochorismate synthase n=1 Tax=Riemerella columbipharyngis TaxID=1071918 RepID=A0A1G6YAC8_9FLAO|nr:chorismate-binding protein [Riemerella columbipharyngis]SDD87320.1 isochorismate synthase [Riemerella columbipharyngis]
MNYTLFRLPNNTEVYKIEHNQGYNTVDFFDFDGAKCFDFSGEAVEVPKHRLSELNLTSQSLEANKDSDENISRKDYEDTVQKIIDFVKENNLKKMVYARKKTISFQDKYLDLKNTFIQLCEKYPSAFVYLLIQNGKCWIGATPELLGKYNTITETFSTMSLAGTLSIGEEWTDKEIEEQKPVTEYIKNILSEFSSRVGVSDTYTVESGNIQHLRNDFEINTKAENVEKIIYALHPTPAVCGYPKEFCRENIKKFELFDRALYSGYIRVKSEDNFFYFVNLRCAEIFENSISLYVGGGITAQSIPEKEWQETELKSEVITDSLKWL